MMGSQSSLDEAIANICTAELIPEQMGNVIEEEKENTNSQNELKGLLDDDGDEDFLALNF